MRHIESNGKYILVLSRGEETIDVLTSFCNKLGVSSGWIQGLGGALSAELGFYNLDNKEYEKHQLNDGPYEVSGLQGNVAKSEDEITLHVHATLAGSSLASQTGHIHSLVTGGTLELLLTPFEYQLERVLDADTGLKPISLS